MKDDDNEADASSKGHGMSPFLQNVFVAVLSPCVAALGYLYMAQGDNISKLSVEMARDEANSSAMVNLMGKVENDLATISSKYVDVQVSLETLRGNEKEAKDEIGRFKEDLERTRQDRIQEINDVRKRLDEVESTIAPIRGADSGTRWNPGSRPGER